jgi:hypothetical protein
MDFIEKHQDKDWAWSEIIKQNKNLTIEIIKKYHSKVWDWDNGISKNSFKIDYENELFKLQNFKMIEEELIQKTWHPSRFQEWCLDEEDKFS